MEDNRPRNIDKFSLLTTIAWNKTMLASMAHRTSGILIFLSIPILLWALGTSLRSEAGFDLVATVFTGVFAKLILWAIVSFFIYHFFAGIKHLFMDAGYAETLEGADMAFYLVVGASVVFILLAGVWLW